MNLKYSSLIFAGLSVLTACKQNVEPLAQLSPAPLDINISGSLQQPEWQSLEQTGDARNFVLRPAGVDNYPKIVFSDIEAGSSFEAFVSCVWLQVQDHNQGEQDRVMIVEDHGKPNVYNTQTSAGEYQGAKKGISRVVKSGDGKYRFLIGYTDGTNANNTDKQRPIQQYRTNQQYRFIAAVNPPRKPGELHRAYYPTTTASSSNMPPLKLVDGDYVVGMQGSNRQSTDFFKLPLFSQFGKETATQTALKSGVETSFRMAGALLALKLDNRTGEEIVVKKIRAKSNDLAFTGYYELWNAHSVAPNGSNDLFNPNALKGTPVFARANSPSEHTNKAAEVYHFDLQTSAGVSGLNVQANQSLPGRFYLWGAIDLHTTANFQTLLQVEYSYASRPNETYYAETVNVTPQNGRFANHTAYLVTVPVQRPRLSLNIPMATYFGDKEPLEEDFEETPAP